MSSRRTLLLLTLSTVTLSAQVQLAFGVRGGFWGNLNHRPGGGPWGNITPGESRSYIIGPVLQLRVREHLALEFSPLYRRLGWSQSNGLLSGGSSGLGLTPGQPVLAGYRARGHAVELPLVAKYYFGHRGDRARPFLGTGYSWTWMSVSGDQEIGFAGESRRQRSKFSGQREGALGVVMTGGAEIKAGSVHWVPEVRYTRRDRTNATTATPIGRNQFDFPLGLRF